MVVYCDKDGNCIAEFRHQMQHCSEGKVDQFDDACQYYHAGECGIEHLLTDDQKISVRNPKQ
jgi:predicted nucleic acid-binding protein